VWSSELAELGGDKFERRGCGGRSFFAIGDGTGVGGTIDV
jgi:hypothetical protein